MNIYIHDDQNMFDLLNNGIILIQPNVLFEIPKNGYFNGKLNRNWIVNVKIQNSKFKSNYKCNLIKLVMVMNSFLIPC